MSAYKGWFARIKAALGKVAENVFTDLLSTSIKTLGAVVFVGITSIVTLAWCATSKVAVIVAEDNDKIDNQLLSYIRTEVEEKIGQCSRFSVVEWYNGSNDKKLQSQIEAIKRSNSGLFDEEQALQIGKLVQARYVLLVGVPYLRSSRRSLPGSVRSDLDIIQMQMSISMRLQDATTGAYPFVKREEGVRKFFPEGSDDNLSVIEQEKLASELIDRFKCPNI